MVRISALLGCAVLVLLSPLVGAGPDPTVLTGKVVDPSGALFAKARLLGAMDFYDPDNKAVAERFPLSGLSVAADGTFVVRQGTMRTGVKVLRFRFVASAAGYSTSDEVVRVAGPDLAIVKLRPGVDHELRVLDDLTQAPIAGAAVITDCTALQQRTLVGVDGRILLHGCDDRGTNPMMAEAPGYVTGGVNTDYTKAQQTITLSKLRSLRLHVTDAATGAAVGGCAIMVEGVTRSTDKAGRVDHTAPYGIVPAEPSCSGYGRNLDAPPAVTWGAADAAAIHELKLRHNIAVDGRVVDGKGKPLAGVAVDARAINEISRARAAPIATSTTDQAGRFQFDSFSADEFHLFVAGPQWTSDAKLIVWKAQKGPITLVAKPSR